MNAESCKQLVAKSRQNQQDSKLPRLLVRIGKRATVGKSLLVTFTTRGIRSNLKSNGFKVYSILGLTLITW